MLAAVAVAASCCAQALTPAEALDRYLASSTGQRACTDFISAVQIDASIPKLRKQGRMTGLKRVSGSGQVIYRSLQFTGDRVIRTAVIARFLARDAKPAANMEDAPLSRRSYRVTYEKSADYNGVTAYVYHVNPRRKSAGVFRGELWLAADTAAPLRLWGDLVKSPSMLIRGFRFVQDYRMGGTCPQPLRLLLTVRTRIVGTVEVAVWLYPSPEEPQPPGTEESTSVLPEPAAMRVAHDLP